MNTINLPSSSSSSSSSNVYQEDFHGHRKLLLHNPFVLTPSSPPEPNETLSGNALMLLSILICGIICSLGLHYIIRCVFRRSSSSFMISDPISSNPSTSNRGFKQKVLKMFPVVTYSPEMMNLSSLGDECVICLSDFVSGEQLRLLPKCNHGFHLRCIDKWLKLNLSCPKCRHSLVETCQKILDTNCNQSEVITTTTITTTTVTQIAPLEPEERINIYRGSN